MTPLLETIEAVKRFGPATAVDGVSLTLHRGEVLGLLGANGAGKTTLIRMILGLTSVTSGSVRLFGSAPSRTARERLGYVPQSLGLYRDLSVTENLAFIGGAFGVEQPTLDDDLAASAGRLVGDLPLGMQRRVAFVAALSHQPDALILDEPTSGVGPLGRAELWDTIRNAAEAGTGVLVTTHYMEEAVQCDRLVILAEGRTVASGRPDEIVAGHTTVEIEAPDPNAVIGALTTRQIHAFPAGSTIRVPAAAPEAVTEILADAGIEGEVSTTTSDLDEMFFAVAGR